MITCDEAKRQFTALDQGESEEQESQQVQEHLETCEKCTVELREMKAAVQLLRSMEPEGVPEGFAERVVAALPRRKGWETWGMGWKLAWGGGVAVLACAFLGLGVYLGRMNAEKRVALAPGGAVPSAAAEARLEAPMRTPKGPAASEQFARAPLAAQPPLTAQPPSAGLRPTAPPQPVATGRAAPRDELGARKGSMGGIATPIPSREREVAPPASDLSQVRMQAPPVSPPAPGAAGSAAGAVGPTGLGYGGYGGARAGAPAPAASEGEGTQEKAAGEATGANVVSQSQLGAGGRLDVDLKAADLPDALQLVASAANRSLVVGADVKGTVTLTMRNVTVEEVLDRFEKDFNLSVKETGNTLVVTNAAPVSAPPAEKASQP